MIGWHLGVMESINLTLVVGLSVDYAVHLADGYVRCEYSDRARRVKHMLGNVGVSVLAGAATTLGASAFMLGSKILFFFQFGIFIFCTIGFSIVYALVVFTIVIGLIGPEGDQGNILHIFDYFKRKKKDTPHLPMPPKTAGDALTANAERLNATTDSVEGVDDISLKTVTNEYSLNDASKVAMSTDVLFTGKRDCDEDEKLICETKAI